MPVLALPLAAETASTAPAPVAETDAPALTCAVAAPAAAVLMGCAAEPATACVPPTWVLATVPGEPAAALDPLDEGACELPPWICEAFCW